MFSARPVLRSQPREPSPSKGKETQRPAVAGETYSSLFWSNSELRFHSDVLEQLIRIDIHRRDDVFGQRQLFERFADEPAQAHDRCAAQQNVKTKLALKFFQRRRRRIAQHEFGAE